MHRMSIGKSVALIALLLAPAAVFAQDAGYTSSAQPRGRFELTPTVSYNFGGTITGAVVAPFTAIAVTLMYFQLTARETTEAEPA